MKILILYQSKYGATAKYANMLKNNLSCECKNVKEIKQVDWDAYDGIIFAGAIYASGIAILSILRKHYPALKQKRLAIFCVGASPFEPDDFAEIKKRNLKEDLADIPLFYGRGAWDESQMTIMDRTLCKLLQKAVKKKDPNTYEPWEKALMEAGGKSCSWIEEAYLLPLVEYMKS